MKIKTFYINNQVNLVFSLLAGTFFCVGLVGVFFDPVYSYLLTAGAVWGIFCIYYHFNKDTDLLEPINFIFLDVLGGTICRLLYMFLCPDRPNVTQYLLLGLGIHVVIDGGILVVFGLTIMMFGYILGKRRTRLKKWKVGFGLTGYFKKDNRLPYVIFGLLCVSAIGLTIFYKIFGITFFTTFTKKFVTETNDAGDLTKDSLGVPRILLLQSQVAYLVYITWFYMKGKKLISWYGAVLVFLFIVGNAPELFLSSRLPIVWNIFYWMALSLIFLKKRKFPWVQVITVFTIVAFVIVIIGLLRQAGKNVSNEDLSVTGDSFVDKIFGNRNLLGCDKTGIIFDDIGQNKYQFEYGESYADLFLAPIPKSLWVNKPDVSLGSRVQTLFIGPLGPGGPTPPGLIAEGYIEFGWFGFIIVFLYGYFMAYMYNVFKNSVQSSSFLIYFFFCYHFGFNMIGDGFEKAASQFIFDIVPIYCMLRILK